MMHTYALKGPAARKTNPRSGMHRQRRHREIETQSGRCPLCNRVMSICIGAGGPAYLCGCRK